MSIKNKVLAGAAALSVIAGGAGVAAASANASTPSCGSSCANIWSANWGHRFVLDVYKQQDTTGNKVILFRGSNSDPAQDFTVSAWGTVNEIASVYPGFVSPALQLHYGNDQAYEIQYSPFGSGGNNLCLGVAKTAGNGTPVMLQPCGVSAKTLWVSQYVGRHGEKVLVNGSDTNFSHPYVLTYPFSSAPTDNPRPGLRTWNLNVDSRGFVASNQVWHGYPF
jgi:hypothetical protein